jgi:hypothetical protein
VIWKSDVASDEGRGHLAFTVALAAIAGAVFWVPALRGTAPDWPAPLDDVLIHFDFARAAAQGHPGAWIAGQGFSSGETSPLYALVLAFGYAIGFRGLSLGIWGGIVAAFGVVVLIRSLRTLIRPAPAWAAWLAAPIVVSVGVIDWSWFSGMETALFGAVLGRALVAVQRAIDAPPHRRRQAAWRVGGWGALLVATRPEAALLVAAFAVVVARHARSQSALAALARVALPGAVVTSAVLGLNLALTGDAMSAGAVLKLLSRNPYLSDVERAREFALNLYHLRYKVLEGNAGWFLFALLASIALFARRTRALAAACLAGATGWALLVSWNGAARYQNFRYYVPALVLVLVAATLGLAALARHRKLRLAGAALASAAIALAASRIPAQARHFALASRNIHDQQIEVGRRLAALTPRSATILVGDAGAIPYVSERRAVDALGLGGFRAVPFARAAPHGEGAIAEMLQRVPRDLRPTHMALYPNWFGAITDAFGRAIDRVTIADNVICGGPTKVIYAADFSPLDAPDPLEAGALDSLDVADVLSEAEHRYASPAPFGGWTVLEVHGGFFDGGRVVPEGRAERFVARAGAPVVTVVLRANEDAGEVLVSVGVRDGVPMERLRGGGWTFFAARVADGLAAGDAITLRARKGEYRSFHVYVLRDASARVTR